MTILGLVPARGGSKRLPGKNLKCLNGMPLVEIAVMKIMMLRAMGIDIHPRVSTDSEEIKAIFPEHVCPRLRSRHLSGDDADSWAVVESEMGWSTYSHCLLLQCTSPLLPVSVLYNLAQCSKPTAIAYNGNECGAWLVPRGEYPGDLSQLAIPSQSPAAAIDIDTQEDFDMAEELLKSHLITLMG